MVFKRVLRLILAFNFLILPLKGRGDLFVQKNAEPIFYLDLRDYPELKLKVEKKEEKIENVGIGKTEGTASRAELELLFNKYSDRYGVSKQLLKSIARCESSFNPQAVNGPYAGMYQFLTSTWIADRKAMGLNSDPRLRFNVEESIKTTAFKISRNGTDAWPVCGK